MPDITASVLAKLQNKAKERALGLIPYFLPQNESVLAASHEVSVCSVLIPTGLFSYSDASVGELNHKNLLKEF